MATAADSYRLSVSLEELFPIRTFRFIVCNTLAPGSETRVTNRRHPVLFYMLNGTVELQTEEKTVILRTGDFYFLDIGTSQVYRNLSPENTYMNVIGFSFTDPTLRIGDLKLPYSGNFLSSPIATGLFHKLHHCWMEQKPGYRLKVLALFFNILYCISASRQESLEIPPEYHRLQDVVRYIYDNCFTSDMVSLNEKRPS